MVRFLVVILTFTTLSKSILPFMPLIVTLCLFVFFHYHIANPFPYNVSPPSSIQITILIQKESTNNISTVLHFLLLNRNDLSKSSVGVTGLVTT